MTKKNQVYDQLCTEISKRLQEGIMTLPTEKVMCQTWKISRQTLRSVLYRLKEENLIRSRQGSGHLLTGLYPGRSNRIAVLIDDDEQYTRPMLLSALTRRLDQAHYQTEVILTAGDTGAERAALEHLVADPPQGLLSWTQHALLPTPNADLYTALSDAGCRIVFPAGRYPNVEVGNAVLPDDRQGGYRLTRYLLHLQHTHIGCILFSDDMQGQQRYLGYCGAMLEQGLQIRDDYILRIRPAEMTRIRKEHNSLLITRLLADLPGDTTAVICQTDELAFWAGRSLLQKGWKIPAQISLAGFDSSYLCDTGRYTLTSMRREPISEAETACSAILALLRNQPLPDAGTWQLVIGDSCTRAESYRSPF